jgi:hypothetical protein
MDEEEFKKLESPVADIKGDKEKQEEELLGIYRTIVEVLKEYCDLREDYYNIIALWIIGTYYHDDFFTFPYLFLNAMKGSGKTRTLKLITYLSKEGSMLGSLTEAVMFRTKGTLAIDEFEGIQRKGTESLKELLNAAYKKGSTVKRMKKVKGLTGEEQVVEEFNVYRPILMANIWGMDNVLGDRCITLVLEKSNNTSVVNLVELWEMDEKITTLKTTLISKGKCSLCSYFAVGRIYKGWNNYCKGLLNTELHTTLTTLTTLTTQQLFDKLSDAKINGRDLEICFPLIIISTLVGELDQTLEDLIGIVKERKEEDNFESIDISLLDFIAQEVDVNYFISIKDLTQNFKNHLGNNEDWINDKWMGRALKRLNLIKEKKRIHTGMQVIINYNKAQEKIRMFK